MDKLKSLILSVGLLVGSLGFFYRWKPRERRLWWTIFLVCAYSNGTRNCSVWATWIHGGEKNRSGDSRGKAPRKDACKTWMRSIPEANLSRSPWYG